MEEAAVRERGRKESRVSAATPSLSCTHTLRHTHTYTHTRPSILLPGSVAVWPERCRNPPAGEEAECVSRNGHMWRREAGETLSRRDDQIASGLNGQLNRTVRA